MKKEDFNWYQKNVHVVECTKNVEEHSHITKNKECALYAIVGVICAPFYIGNLCDALGERPISVETTVSYGLPSILIIAMISIATIFWTQQYLLSRRKTESVLIFSWLQLFEQCNDKKRDAEDSFIECYFYEGKQITDYIPLWQKKFYPGAEVIFAGEIDQAKATTKKVSQKVIFEKARNMLEKKIDAKDRKRRRREKVQISQPMPIET